MKKPMITSIALISLMGVPVQGAPGYSRTHVETYITAKDTGQRLAKAGEAELAESPPAIEKEEYIFVDPA